MRCKVGLTRAPRIAVPVVVVGILTWGASSDAQVDAGGAACATSGECAPPFPYCHPSLFECVECLGDAHCSGRMCDTTRGVCTACLSDLDCAGVRPYCSDEQRACVECLTDTNCNFAGVACLDGECGYCGDDVCGPYESFRNTGSAEYCPGDCGCPTADLGSAVGAAVATGSSVAALNVSQGYCGGASGPEVSFLWTAPAAGYYTLDTIGSDFDAVLYLLQGGCSGYEWGCGVGTPVYPIYFSDGQSVVVVIDGAGSSGGNYVLNITTLCGNSVIDPAESCDGTNLQGYSCATFGYGSGVLTCNSTCSFDTSMCVPSTGGTGGAGGAGGTSGGDDAGSETIDAGAIPEGHCMCPECFDAEQACHWDLGCVEIVGCAVENDCDHLGGCYAPDECQDRIDAAGGPSSPSAQAAGVLLSCLAGAGCDKNDCAKGDWLDPCTLYCAILGNTCTDENVQYPSPEDCLASCAALPTGQIHVVGNSLHCRYAQLHPASEDSTKCSAAGPAGVTPWGSVCGAPCEAYCSIVLNSCPSAYADVVDCLATCSTFPGSGVPIFHANDFDDGDTFQCRLKQALQAWRGEEWCDAAGPASEGVCGAAENATLDASVGALDSGFDVDGAVVAPADAATDAGSDGSTSDACGCSTPGARRQGREVLLVAGWLVAVLFRRRTRPRHDPRQ